MITIPNKSGKYKIKRSTLSYASLVIFMLSLIFGCSNNNSVPNDQNSEPVISSENISKDVANKASFDTLLTNNPEIKTDNGYTVTAKLGHHINTTACEYFPVINPLSGRLYFTGMDRTGFFDFKLDFTKSKSSGGEDIFFSNLVDGTYEDARPLTFLNTNSHEAVTDCFKNGDLLVIANYPEKLGPKSKNNGLETTDIFLAKFSGNDYQLIHMPEPVNSIFNEADAVSNDKLDYLLFVSDRQGNVGQFHKKGWRWNENLWGNTDVYVSIKVNGEWQVPVNLGTDVNSPAAERTPWLSKDGLTLYVSSNGYRTGRNDLDIYSFKRSDINNWTEWDGPYDIVGANTLLDDWGYKAINEGNAYFARARKKNYNTTQGGANGDGYIRETNYRTGYELTGAQIASLSGDQITDIYLLLSSQTPAVSFPDILFRFDSDELNPATKATLIRLLDFLGENPGKVITLIGHTDNFGTDKYNQSLSLRRAESIKNYLLENGTNSEIVSMGSGSEKPIADNATKSGRQRNRRVDVFLK